MLRPFTLLFASALFCISSQAQTKTREPIPFNSFQWLATHNSYHLAPPEKLRELIDNFSPGAGAALDYTFAPLPDQLDAGIRGLELDLYHDPKGGLYSNAFALQFAANESDNEEIY